MENIKVEVKDVDVTKEETQTVEQVKREVLKALNDWSLFTMEER